MVEGSWIEEGVGSASRVGEYPAEQPQSLQQREDKIDYLQEGRTAIWDDDLFWDFVFREERSDDGRVSAFEGGKQRPRRSGKRGGLCPLKCSLNRLKRLVCLGRELRKKEVIESGDRQ